MDSESNDFASFSRRLLRGITPRFLVDFGPTIPVIRFSGVIGGIVPFRPGPSLAACASALDRAFQITSAPAVALQINSPGGSPVQSRLIYERIRSLAAETSKKVYVFAEDVAASGGYLLALAGDEIYADASSIVGSIGVATTGFGFVGLMEKLGVERRVYTAGENKSQLDPFRPEKAEEVERLKKLQTIIHEDFIALVKERRGNKLLTDRAGLFTGEFWSGRQALELGLIDGIMDIRTKMRSLYGEEVRLKLIPQERGWFRKRTGVGASFPDDGFGPALGASVAAGVLAAVEERLHWARFGL